VEQAGLGEGTAMAAKVLFIGESWTTLGIHLKGFGNYMSGEYQEGGAPLIDALAEHGLDVTYLRCHEVATKFPNSVEGLTGYDTIILSDGGADTFLLRPDTFRNSKIIGNPLVDIADHVAAGAGLLMVGGYLSFSGFGGNACYPNTVLAEVLPVDMVRGDDRIERPEGVIPRRNADHAVLDGISDPWPPFLGYQKLLAKDGSEVLLKAGADPFLVVGQHGKGRVAAFASDCSPHWGTPEFVNWKDYGKFWGQLVSWLGDARA